MIEQHSYSGDYTNRYKFNGKELDEETGFYYYGARYYNPKFSIWLSTDPLMEKYPNFNPYVYCANNPILYIDPDGRDWYRNWITGNITWKEGTGDKFGYDTYGTTWGVTDANANRFEMNGNTKQITFNGKVLYDYNKDPDGSFGGFAFADGSGNDKQDPSSLRKGGRDADWTDFNGAFEWLTTFFSIGPKKTTPNGKGTNGGRPVSADKINDAVTVVDKAAGATNEVVTAKEKANKKEAQAKPQKPEDIYHISKDKQSGNNIYLNKNHYNKDGTPKKD